jgi:CO dehydrogenase maturation factor
MYSQSNSGTIVIAVCGKGGVGKTSLSASMVKILASNPVNRVLAVDADPAVGLASALGIAVHKTVDDIRNELIARVTNEEAGDRAEMLAMLDYEMFSALEERDNLAFLAIGRPEKEGCYCQVNHILKDIIASIASSFDFVVIDGEAGIEQVNRRVMERVSHMVLVSDVSAKGLNVVRTIKDVAKASVSYRKMGLIINRQHDAAEKILVALPTDIDCLGWIPEDDAIRTFDIAGKSILGLPDCPALTATRACLTTFGVLP